MESETRRRGYDPEDNKWFSERELERMRSAQEEIRFLLDRGYRMEQSLASLETTTSSPYGRGAPFSVPHLPPASRLDALQGDSHQKPFRMVRLK